jgi:hypothetical protein
MDIFAGLILKHAALSKLATKGRISINDEFRSTEIGRGEEETHHQEH